MISATDKIAKKKRKVLGPLGRFLLKIFRWEIKGKIPDLEKMILIGRAEARKKVPIKKEFCPKSNELICFNWVTFFKNI